MRTFDVQAIEISAPSQVAFEFIRDPRNLPQWAHAFESADARQAVLATAQGSVDIGLRTTADAVSGTIDWNLEFPDGATAVAQSRVTPTLRGTSIYSFVLHAPPVPLEQLEGALAAQSVTLRQELSELKKILEA